MTAALENRQAPGLFSPIRINGLETPNRFMRSATYDGLADRGRAAPAQAALYRRLAEGGVGLIISGLINVSRDGRLSPFQNSLSDDSFVEGLGGITAAVHQAGSKVAAQLAHAGRESSLPDGRFPAGPSAQEGGPDYLGRCRALEEDEVERIIMDFGLAAGRARAAGFDAVQLHAAHAYLPAQFLSPLANRREDRWGGPLENRLRFHLEILKAMRREVGPDYPLLIKLGLADGPPGGLGLEQGLAAAVRLAEAGFDCLEISQGLRGADYEQMEFRTRMTAERQNYFADWAARVKAAVDKPVAMVGGLRDFAAIQACLDQGLADLAALSRPLIQEPDLIERWRTDPGYKPGCVSCNRCMDLVRAGRALACGVTDRESREFLKQLKKEKD